MPNTWYRAVPGLMKKLKLKIKNGFKTFHFKFLYLIF